MNNNDIEVLSVEVLPDKVEMGMIYNINTNNVAYLTHNFFKYPCKFIPQIPKWALDSFISVPSKNVKVYDPFVGSGTTLVESSLKGFIGSGSDIDPLGRLLTRVKAGQYNNDDIKDIKTNIDKVFLLMKTPRVNVHAPKLPNINHWFEKKIIKKLAKIKFAIDSVESKKANEFLMIVLASVIRKSSLADEMSPKPYISTRFKKETIDPEDLFIKRANDYFRRIKEYSLLAKGDVRYIGNDARKSEIKSNTIDIAITSPPYINAFDYVRTLKLENYWLDLVDDETSKEIRINNVGTESVGFKTDYESINIPCLRSVVNNISLVDKKRGQIVDKYFSDMKSNLIDVHRVLKHRSKYVIVVADSLIRNEYVPTKDILIEIAKENGFKYFTHFGYVIRNRYLRIPRSGKGGFMKVDWVIVLEKE